MDISLICCVAMKILCGAMGRTPDLRSEDLGLIYFHLILTLCYLGKSLHRGVSVSQSIERG